VLSVGYMPPRHLGINKFVKGRNMLKLTGPMSILVIKELLNGIYIYHLLVYLEHETIRLVNPWEWVIGICLLIF
jgi:hypothetical protein